MTDRLAVSGEALALREGDRVVGVRTNLRGTVLSVTYVSNEARLTPIYVLAVETEDGGIVRIKHPGIGLRKAESA